MKLVSSLRYCKGTTENSMFSAILPRYEDIETLIKEIESLKAIYCSSDSYFDIDDDIDSKYRLMAYNEAISFLNGIRWQDLDKERIGLLVYCGFIETPNEEPKKVYHSFPIRKGELPLETYTGQRFNLGYLNRVKDYTDQFGRIE